MSLLVGWESICRICLKEGDLNPIFDGDEDVSAKIMLCLAIEIKKGVNLPDQICDNCLSDLETSCKFRKNCEASEAILNSIVITNSDSRAMNEVVFSTDSGDVYKFRAPSSLNVKRIKKESVSVASVAPVEVTVMEPDPEPDDREPDFEFIDQNTVEYVEGDDSLVDEDDNTVYYVEQLQEDELEYYEPVDKVSSEVDGGPSVDDATATTSNEEFLSPQTIKQFKNVTRPPNKFVPKPENDVTILGSAEIITKENGKKVYRVKRMFKEETKPLKECKLCGNQYKYQHALDSHMRRHNNDKPFECDICGKAFVINFELNRHKRIHSGEKPYKCHFCDRRFSDFGSRIKHERTHTGERPYECKICGKAFAYSHVLNSHNLIHTGEKKYHCTTCGKRFTKSHHLKAHLNIHEKSKGNKGSLSRPAPETRYYTDVMKVITPSIRTIEDEEIRGIQDGDIIQSDGLTVLETDDIDIKEGISMIFEDGTIVQAN